MRTLRSILYIFILITLFTCSTNGKREIPETPTSGILKFFCEQGFSVPIKNQVFTFQRIYDRATVQITNVTEKDAIQALYNDCCKVILIPRQLSTGEQKKFNLANIYPKETCIARNALALIVPIGSPDSSVSVPRLLSILSGTDTSYKLVFDNQNSGSARYLADSLLQGKPFGKNCFAVKSTEELIERVAASSISPKVKRTIGIMDYSFISDKDETITKNILTKVRPIAVSKNEKDTAYFPDQANIETRDYPFCRYMYIIRRSGDFSLGAGFIAFVAGEKGQLMFLKAGLIPAFRHERMISIDVSPLNGDEKPQK